MPARRAFVLPLALLLGGVPAALPVAAPNDNRRPAGELRDGVLHLSLDATMATWHPDGDSLPGLDVAAFAESGRAPSAPGPLVRVRAGTELRVAVRNLLPRDTITFHLPAKMDAAAPDSLVLAPGERGELRARATRPGNYVYLGNGLTAVDRVLRMRGLLAGAIVVDSATHRGPPRDRVLVLVDPVDSITPAGIPDTRRELPAVNGRSWPHTERLEATVGDTVRWRVINASSGVHPMHLHGFYFRVERFDAPGIIAPSQREDGRMVVTERLAPFTAMLVSWVPERPGNWLFHCHYQPHASPHRQLGARPAPRDTASHDAEHHARTGMGGMVLGIGVRARPGHAAATPSAARRRLRLVAVRDAGFPDSLPSMRFRLEDERGRRSDAGIGISPTLDLRRGEPVSVTVVNQLGEPLSVHWHGIELESYFDGVAGFAGEARRLAPVIAPRDSFEARFTPPRSGTFMYHSHMDEVRHHRAGLVGAIVVRDPGDAGTNDRLFFLKSSRATRSSAPMEVNGRVNPDTLVLRVGETYRLRFLGLTVTSPNAMVLLTARPDSSLANTVDSLVVQWTPLAKDGAELPASRRTPREARQIVSIGETHDFAFTPARRGLLRIEVRPQTARQLFARVPVRVE